MRFVRLGFTTLIVASSLASCGSDEATTQVSALTISDAWARTTPATATNGVVYLTVVSPAEDTIIGVSVPVDVAADAAMHETMGGGGASPMPNMPDMTTAGGEMTMAPIAEVPVVAGAMVVFEPGGKHIMLTGLAAPLRAGDHFTLTVRFATAGSREIDVVVADGPPA